MWNKPRKENLLSGLTHQWIVDEFLVFKNWPIFHLRKVSLPLVTPQEANGRSQCAVPFGNAFFGVVKLFSKNE